MTFSDAAAREFPPFSTDACIKCNVCTTVCPVSRVTDAFPGPKYVGPQAQRFRGPSAQTSSPDRTVDLCSGCGICTRACPAGVLIAETNSRARAAIVDERGSSLRNRLISDTDLLIRLGANSLAPLANFGLRKPLRRAGWARRWLACIGEARSLRSRVARSAPGGGDRIGRSTLPARAIRSERSCISMAAR